MISGVGLFETMKIHGNFPESENLHQFQTFFEKLWKSEKL